MLRRLRPLITYGALLWPGLLVAALIAWQVMPCFYMSADSAAYVELARSLASGRGYTFNEEPFFGYQPVFPGILALGIVILGDSVLMMRIVVALSAAISSVIWFHCATPCATARCSRSGATTPKRHTAANRVSRAES